ncbi:MAG: M20/M25/M40 family metallo-hydrolase [Bernardetiaceae bacterium]|nr:M20/M25/M40 family metallo-hydrolase [Bernardetiaceae bacterium]
MLNYWLNLKFCYAIVLFICFCGIASLHLQAQSSTSKTEQTLRAIFDEALTNNVAYQNLDYLANQIGGRLSGSPQAAAAVEFARQVMDTMDLDKVFLQEVMVPHWVRGTPERCSLLGQHKNLAVCALGGSVATPNAGIRAEVVEVKSFEDLEKLGKKNIEGKIVFFNTPMDPKFINTFHAYGGCAQYRVKGASQAAKYGAVAVLVRSLTLRIDDYPHTGVMVYEDENEVKIPAAALSTLASETLSEALQENPKERVFLKMSCKTLPDVLSHNVIGEIKGSEKPDEIILIGGHLDSWDIGDGAHDDGAGCVQAIEVLRIFKALGIKPKRTIRAVLFMNEENGARGAAEYARVAEAEKLLHFAAIESDRGGFTPRGFTIDSEDPKTIAMFDKWRPLLAPFDLHKIEKGYSGVDIKPLEHVHIDSKNTILLGYEPDSQRYFDYHHAATDVFEAVNPRELALGAAAMAALVYLLDGEE